MRVRLGCLSIAFIAGLYSFSYAQTRSSAIRGSVFLENKTAAESATVILLNQLDSTIVLSALADSRGLFKFINIKPGNYFLVATRLGSQRSYTNGFQLLAGRDIEVNPIILIGTSKTLAEVSVISKKSFIETRPGKIIINPQASITADGKSALDILKQSPGVRVDNNDNITISGKQSALILIDGNATNLAISDLATLLKSTPGGTIDRIELITGGSAKYDASAGGVINIVLKKGKNIGTNGSFNLSAGYGRYYKSASGFTFNSRSKYVNIFGGYNIIANKTYKAFTNDRNIISGGVNSSYNLNYNGIQEYVTHTYRLGADFSLSPNNTLGFLVSGFSNNNNFTKNNSLNIANQGHPDSMIAVNSKLDRDLRNINYNINYTGKLDEAGKTLSANVTYSPYTRQSDEYINNKFYNAAGIMYRNPLLLQNLSPSNRYNLTGLIDYVNPLSKSSNLSAGAKFSYTKSNNNLIFGPLVNNQYTIDPNFTNEFIYTERRNDLYVNYNGTFKKLDLTFGLRGEYTNSEGNSVTLNQVTPLKYFKLFPNLLLSYHYNNKHEFALTFTRGITRPDYESLNPFLYYIDPYNYQSGNPYLKPEYSNSLRFTHIYDQSITTALYATFITDASFAFFQQNDVTKVNLTTNRNLGRTFAYGLEINAPVKFTSWWNGNFDADASYQRYKVYPQNGILDKGTGDLIFTSNQNFAISKKITAEINGRYETPTFYGIRQFKANYYTGAGIATQLFGSRGKLSLTITDIFNTDRDRAYTNFQNLDLRFYSKIESRVTRLTFTYRFGKNSVKGSSRHVTGNEDEQNRMKKSN